MLPVLFSYFGFQIQSYGASKALAALVGAYLLGRAFQRHGFDKQIAHSLVLWATVWGFIAAKVYFVIENLPHLNWHMLGGSGFVWYGGLLGGVAAASVVIVRNGLPWGTVAGAFAAPLSVAYGIGRIGCFLAGDGTYGKPTSLPWGMAFPDGVVPTDVAVHPTPLYETLAAFLIAGALWALGRRWTPIAVFGAYLGLSGLARLLVEFLRVNDPVWIGLTGAQLFSIASMIIGVFLIVKGQSVRPDRSGSPDLEGQPVAAGS